MTKPLTALLARWTCALAFAAGLLGLGAASAQAETRVPELVSNTDTNSSDVADLLRTSADGHSIAWYSLASYAGAKGANGYGVYVGRRTGDGWRVIPFWPDTREGVRPGLTSLIGGFFFPGDLSSMFGIAHGAYDPTDLDYTAGSQTAYDVYKFVDGSATWISHPQGVPDGLHNARIAGLSEDGSTAFFTTPDPLTPEVAPGMEQLYQYRNGIVKAVGRDADGVLLNIATLGNGTSDSLASGAGQGGQAADSVAVSTDGTRFVYREGNAIGYSRVFLHEDGARDVEISLSQRDGSVGQRGSAMMVGSTPELQKIYLQSTQQLSNDAPAGGGDYVYDITTGQLSFSNIDNGWQEHSSEESVYKSGIVNISPDGEYLYFLSTSVLAPGAETGGRNLYLKRGSEIELIGVLDPSGKDAQLAVLPLKGQSSYVAYTRSGTNDAGDRLVFLSAASLAGFRTGGHLALYLFDASSRELVCVSCRPDGSPSEGDAGLSGPGSFQTRTPKAISGTGDTVAFATTDALVPADTNGQSDVYEYSHGKITLISGGTSRYASTFGGLSPDGKDLYFKTRDSLVANDTNNGFTDVYDARIGGRRDPEVGGDVSCAGDDCQGPAAERVEVAAPGSSALVDGESAPTTVPARSVTFRVRTLTAAQRASLARGRQIEVSVTPSAPGVIAVTLTGKVRGRTRTVAAGGGVTTRAATVRVALQLTPSARRELARRARLPVSLSVTMSGAKTSARSTFTLTRASDARRKSARR